MALGHGESPWMAKLGDLEYSGSGLHVHFLHPLHPRMQVSLDDFVGALSFLRTQGILACEPPKLSSPGYFKLSWAQRKALGICKCTGRAGGNWHLGQVRAVRSALLRSPWF